MTLGSTEAVEWTSRLLAAGLVLESAETLAVHRLLAVRHGRVVFLLVARIILAVGLILPFGITTEPYRILMLGMVLCNSLGLVHVMRGPLCGGCDSMSFQVQCGLFIASFEEIQPGCVRLGMTWIAVQSVMSYLCAGLSKLRNPRWWNGEALRVLLTRDGPYAVNPVASGLVSHRFLLALAGSGVILFELVFPGVLWMGSHGRVLVLSAGFLFHLANAVMLGLNRFLWAWLASYPALLHVNSGL